MRELLRRKTTEDLVYDYQGHQDILQAVLVIMAQDFPADLLQSSAEDLLQTSYPAGQEPLNDWIETYVDVHKELSDECRLELERRKGVVYKDNRVDQDIIKVIKDRVDIVEVVGWYADVINFQKNWSFRCPLHEDKHPSGKIFNKERRAWCFQCNKGGDVFDIVEIFGNSTKSEAINKLANYIGLDTKPVHKVKGGISLEYTEG